jgi:hypothetical protein
MQKVQAACLAQHFCSVSAAIAEFHGLRAAVPAGCAGTPLFALKVFGAGGEDRELAAPHTVERRPVAGEEVRRFVLTSHQA